MLFERFEDKNLSHYSYAVGCQQSNELLIVDPRRDIDVYLEFAVQNGFRIVGILETHIHADFASGARELSERSGAQLYVSAYDVGETFEVAFPHSDLVDGDEVGVGNIRLVAMHTPGHTPEHLSYLVYDAARSKEVPMLMLSGDFVFVGSLGRPDLLGEEAKLALAHRQYASVQLLVGLPDGLEIHPAHGAGSMCGAGMSGRPTSTLGFERIANPYLNPALSEEDFVAMLLGSVPPFPAYYRRMKRVNSEGPRILGGLPGVSPLPVDETARLRDEGATVIDLRHKNEFAMGHIEGAFGISINTSVSTWAAWVVPYDTPIVLVAPDVSAVEPAVRQLIRVGLDDVVGYLDGGYDAWLDYEGDTDSLPQIGVAELKAKLDAGEPLTVLDVRNVTEFADGHVEGALNIIAGEIRENAASLPNGNRPIYLICESGNRSTIASSVLLQEGIDNVMNVRGGMIEWRKAGLPLARERGTEGSE